MDDWVSPDIADEQGFLRAGKILEWMDVVGVLAASRHCRNDVVTVSVDGLDLSTPIGIGEHVTMKAAVAYTSPRSMGVSVLLEHSGARRDRGARQISGYMTFVALSAEGAAIPVPPFSPATPAEQERFREGSLRREFRERLIRAEAAAFIDAMQQNVRENPFLLRELLKILPSSFRMPWELRDPRRPRPRGCSYMHKIELVRTAKLNFHGTLYGGTLMGWMESTANLSARAYLEGQPVRFTGLHGLNFIRPVYANLFVHIRSMVAHVVDQSITVLVSVQAEDPVRGEFYDTVRGFLTYTPMKAIGAITRVPPLSCLGEEEEALFNEIESRLMLQRILTG